MEKAVLLSQVINGKLDLTNQVIPYRNKFSTDRWYKMRVNLQQTFKVEKLSDIY